MLTIAKITSNKAGYEVDKDFCLVRDAKKYRKNNLYVSKVLNRFQDSEGNDHFVVTPVSNSPVTDINYDLASKIYTGHRDGIRYLLEDHCPDDLRDVRQCANNHLHYNIDNADDYEQSVYHDFVQEYLSNLAR